MSKLDVIIPVYNEGENIIETLDALGRTVKSPFRVLICYDHDEDTTLPAIRARGGWPFEILPVKNQGKGVHGAVLTGFRASTAPAVVVVTADEPTNAEILDPMIEKFEEGHDIVSASRFMRGGRVEGVPFLKGLLARAGSFVLYHVAGLPTHDSSYGFRMFSRRVIERVPIESTAGFTYSIELLAKCHRLGWKIAEVPAHQPERKHGSSRFRVMKWLPAYLQWFVYILSTTVLFRGPASVRLTGQAEGARGRQ